MLRRSKALAARAAYLCACAFVTVHFLFLPFGGYERMMEGKYFCFLALALGLCAAMAFAAPLPRPEKPRASSGVMRLAAAAYLAFSALSALCSPYGARTLLGGTRREGLLTLALYGALFFAFAAHLRADRRLVALLAASAALGGALVLAQTAGYDPFGLYPAGWNYFDGDVAYAGRFAGTAGNADFTAFLLALAVCVLAAAMLRLRMWRLAPALALALAALWRLDVAGAWLGISFAALWSPALLFPQKRARMLLLSALLSACALLAVRYVPWEGGALAEARALLRGEFDPTFGSSRLFIWQNCLPLVRERPLLGGGPDTLWLRALPALDWYRGGELVPADVTAAHNEYLGVLVNQGALALGAYLALLGTALARCFRRAGEDARFVLCGAGLLCYAAMALFSVSMCITAPYVWMLLSIVHKDEIDC